MNPFCCWTQPIHKGLGTTLLLTVLLFWPGKGWGGEPSSPSVNSSDTAEAHLRLGVDFYLTHELEAAIDQFRTAADQQPGYAQAHFNLGTALAKNGHLKGAMTAWSKARELDPQHFSLTYRFPALIAYNYGISLLKEGHLSAAMKEWGKAIEIQPHFAEAHYALGLAWVARKNPVPAVGHFREALHWAPSWVSAYEGLGLAHYDSNEFDLAREAWNQALTIHPQAARAHAYLGMLSIQEGNFRLGLTASQKALQLTPELPSAHFNSGLASFHLGETAAAVRSLHRALSLDPSLSSAWVLLGRVWSQEGNWSRAIRNWRKALGQADTDSLKVELHFHMGLGLQAMGNISQALNEFHWVVTHRPEWAQGWVQLGQTYLSLHRWKLALVALTKAADLQPQWGHLHYGKGMALVKQEQWDAAVQALEKAIEVEPSYVEAQYRLGLVLRTQNRLEEALRVIEQAATGGSQEAQILLASMYANGSGGDRNVPLAMLWWFRGSEEDLDDDGHTIGRQQLSRIRREFYANRLTSTDQQDVLTGFELIRQDLERSPMVTPAGSPGTNQDSTFEGRAPSRSLLRWVINRALALDKEAQETLLTWYYQGMAEERGSVPSRIQEYFLQTAKEGNVFSCEAIKTWKISSSSEWLKPWTSSVQRCEQFGDHRKVTQRGTP